MSASLHPGRCLWLLTTWCVLWLVCAAPAQLIQGPQDITWGLLANSAHQTTYGLDQIRRFIDQNGQVVAVREALTVAGNNNADSPFRLEYLGVVGQPANSAVDLRWRDTYRRYGSLFHEHGAFRVHDPVRAASNYQKYDFGASTRAGRAVRRVVIVPNLLDKSLWLIEVDVQLGLILYAGEFNAQLRLISELAVTRVRSPAEVGQLSGSWNWQPRLIITDQPNISACSSALSIGDALIDPDLSTITPEYGLIKCHIAEDPLNAARSVVCTYSDGIDEFFIVQTPGQNNPFVLPVRGTNTIAYYDDPSLRVYWFSGRQSMCTVAGRGTLLRLEHVAKHLYRNVLTAR